MREIEADTCEENPPLFREYMSATPEVKQLMDSQFKNVKTHARLLSKAMWYEWRMKLLEGLKEGLLKVREGMDEDEDKLEAQENIIESALPNLILEHEQSKIKYQTLRLRANEFASFDLQELKKARDSLVAIEDELQSKQKVLNVLQNEVAQKEDELEYAIKQRRQYLEEIKEVEKTCQESRSWSILDIAILQGELNNSLNMI